MRLRHVFVFLLVFGFSLTCRAENPASDSTRTRFFGVPLLFYTPDTRWGGGAAGIITFGQPPLRSSVTFGISFTQRKQFLLYLPFQLFSNDGKWRAYGELGWYKYLYQYFGIGNAYSNDFIELYTAKFPRIRLTVTQRLKGAHALGLRWFSDNYNIVETEAGGELAQKLPPGASGGFTSMPGAVWLYDNRDNLFFPTRGSLFEVSAGAEHRLTGSEFRFSRVSFEGSKYFSTGKQTVLALNGVAIFSSPGAPFFNMAQLGGTKRLRGYRDGKYRDQHLVLLQSEWRFPIIWRFKGVAFAGMGAVFGTKNDPFKLRPNAGAGLRFEFDPKQHIHFRLDYGIGQGEGNSGLYLTVGEAF